MKYANVIAIFFSFSFLILFSADAQDPVLRHYSVNDGLPSGSIYRMLKDKEGFLWFATDAGVSRFDGKKFTNFTTADGLADNEVLQIHQDSKGRIWFFGFNGTLSYFYHQKIFNPDNDSLLYKLKSSEFYGSFLEDKQHRLWFYSMSLITMLDDKAITKFYDLPICSGIFFFALSGDAVYYLTRKLAGRDGIFHFDQSRWTRSEASYFKTLQSGGVILPDASMIFISPQGIILQSGIKQKLLAPLNDDLKNTVQPSLYFSSDKKLWISTSSKGALCYDYTDMRKSPEKYLQNSNVSDVTEDNEKNVWIATYGDGVYMLPRWHRKVHNFSKANGLPASNVTCVVKNERGNMYAGFNEGSMSVITQPAKNISWFTHDKGAGISKIAARDKDAFIGSSRHIIHYTIKRDGYSVSRLSARHDPINIKDLTYNDSNIYVASHTTVYKIIHPKAAGVSLYYLEPITFDTARIFCAYAEKSGKLWYGSSKGLMSFCEGQKINHSSEHVLLAKRISDIEQTPDGVLILATYGYGVICYKDGKLLQHLMVDDGLPSNICKRLFIHRDKAYVATPNGLSRIQFANGKSVSIKNYTVGEGLASNNVNDVYADDKEICIATSEGITILSAKDENAVINPPPLYITQINTPSQKNIMDSVLELNYKDNSIHFEFIALTYQLPDEVVYHYRLNDNQQWQSTKNNSLDFPFLSPDDYHFQLQARIANGPWSEVKELRFTITPPFWKTRWFITIVALMGLLLLYHVVQNRIDRFKKKKLEKLQVQNQITQLEQNALKAMMNPHFIFNVMNSIQQYINDNDKHSANIYLSEFAKLIRMNLEISAKSYISLEEEVEYLTLYLKLEQMRFHGRLSFDIHVDASIDTDEAVLPVMLLQPFIENAIWHGILPKQDKGHVQVNITRHVDSLLKVEIIDDGVGLPASMLNGSSKHKSYGTNLIQQRLELIGKLSNKSLYVEYSNNTPTGTKVELTLPAENH